MLSIARRLTHQSDDADDIAQEAFIRLYRNIGRIDPERPLEPWLVRVTVNLARSWLARRRPPGASLREEVLEDPSPAEATRREEARDVRSALGEAAATLPPREREVFVLRDLHGLETQLVAESLEITPVTVRRQSMEARRKVEAWIRRHRPELVPGRSRDAAGEENPSADERTRSRRSREG